MQSKPIETIVYKFAQEIECFDAKLKIREFVCTIKDNYYPDKDTFVNSFVEIGYTKNIGNKKYSQKMNKINMRYILVKFENFYNSTGELSANDFSIEHISNDDGRDVNCKIGNLLPLAGAINNNAGNKSFVEKIPFYNQSNFESVKKFIQFHGSKDKWIDEDILKRGKRLAETAYETIWKL